MTTKRTKTAKSKIAKLGLILDRLEDKTGATLDELVDATGWQKHSVHGALNKIRNELPPMVVADF